MERFLQTASLTILTLLTYFSGAAQEPTQEWVQRYDGSSIVVDNVLLGDDVAVGLAVDSEGNSYVTGTSYGLSIYPQRSAIVTAKYSPEGDKLWVKSYAGNLAAVSKGIAVDNKGGVYVTGTIEDQGISSDYITLRYDAATGEEAWAQRYDDGGRDESAGVAVDNAGGVYVTGSSISAGFSDYATIRYEAATGNISWVQQYDGGQSGGSVPPYYEELAVDDFATAIAVDNKGGVYVTGFYRDWNISSFVGAYATVRYEAATGFQSWAWQNDLDLVSGMLERPADIAIDNQNGVFVTGTSYEFGGGAASYLTVRYNAETGALSWRKSYSTEIGRDDAAAIAVDNAGGVYVTGTSDFGVTLDYATVSYEAATGTLKWEQRYNGSGNGIDRARAIVADSAGVYVTGSSTNENGNATFSTVKYATAGGELLWEVHSEEPAVAVDIVLDGFGNIVVTGVGTNAGTGAGRDFLTIKYSQEPKCTELVEQDIVGAFTVAVSTEDGVYSLPNSGAGSFDWSITDSEGNAYTWFTGQGIESISVDWSSEPNVFKVTVVYGAGSECPSKTASTYVHVYDPTAGFVSGGGWISSPAYADYEHMQASTRAYWGFVAKYRKDNRVKGATLFMLDNGTFTFRSNSYEDGSLVIAGNKAFFRGRGTVVYKGESGNFLTDDRQFGYLLAATDGDLGPYNEADKLRLIVWVMNSNGSQGAVVYDNQVACTADNLDNNLEACSAIEGGNILIHKPVPLPWLSKTKGISMQDKELKVYPMPASDRANISFFLDRANDYTLEVYNVKGSLVKCVANATAEAGKLYEQELVLTGMEAGLYFVRLTTGTDVQTVKLIVER